MAEERKKIPHPGAEQEQRWRKLLAEGNTLRFGEGFLVSTLRELADYVEGIEAPEEPEAEESGQPEPDAEAIAAFLRLNLQQHIQRGDDGQVRSVFLGPWGDNDRTDDDPELPSILAVTKEEWDKDLQPALEEADRLREQIGELPDGDGIPVPNGATWLEDVQRLQSELEQANKDLEAARSQALITGPSVDLKARLMTVPNMTERRADEIIQALSAAPSA